MSNYEASQLFTDIRIKDKEFLEKTLPFGSEITGFQFFKKLPHERFDTQTVWLYIFYAHNGTQYRCRKSHKNNQYFKVAF